MMDPSVVQGLAGLYIFVALFGLLLAVLWILVPFAIFGIKPLLRTVIRHLESIQKQNNEVIAALRESRQAPVVIREDRPAAP